MKLDEAESLGAGIIAAYQQWEDGLPAGLRLYGDRPRQLCVAMRVPHVGLRPQRRSRAMTGDERDVEEVVYLAESAPTVSGPGEVSWVAITSTDLILAASILLVVDHLDRHGREAEVPTELRAASSIAQMLGLSISRGYL